MTGRSVQRPRVGRHGNIIADWPPPSLIGTCCSRRRNRRGENSREHAQWNREELEKAWIISYSSMHYLLLHQLSIEDIEKRVI